MGSLSYTPACPYHCPHLLHPNPNTPTHPHAPARPLTPTHPTTHAHPPTHPLSHAHIRWRIVSFQVIPETMENLRCPGLVARMPQMCQWCGFTLRGRACTYAHPQAHSHKSMQAHTGARRHTHTHTYTQVHVHTHTHEHSHTHTHAQTQKHTHPARIRRDINTHKHYSMVKYLQKGKTGPGWHFQGGPSFVLAAYRFSPSNCKMTKQIVK